MWKKHRRFFVSLFKGESEVSWEGFVGVVYPSALILLSVAAVAVLARLFVVLGAVIGLLRDLRREIAPVAAKLARILDDVRSELERVEEIVSSVQGVTSKVTSTTEVAQELLASPLIKLAAFSVGARKAIRTLIRGK